MTSFREESGITLLEIVCVLAIIAMLAAVSLPALPRGTSRSMLEGYALQTAAMLKADRNAAIRRGAMVATDVNPVSRTIRSGATGRILQVPPDIAFRAILPAQCEGRVSGRAVQFLPTGMSCGGTIYLARPGTSLEIRVTWLTGGVEIAPSNAF
jgi:general secretion pathway protein H